MATNCENVSAQMMELLYGELPADARANVDAHVAGCARCRAELDGFQKTRAVARQVLDEAPPARARLAILNAAAAHLAAQAQPAAAAAAPAAAAPTPARKPVVEEKFSFWDRLRARWAFPTFATVGAVAVFLVANKMFLDPEKSLEHRPAATQEERAAPPATPPVPSPAAEPAPWEGKPPEAADNEAKMGHRMPPHGARVAAKPAGRADDDREGGERGAKKAKKEEGPFAEPPPAKPAPAPAAAEEKAYRDQHLAKQKAADRTFAPPPPPKAAASVSANKAADKIADDPFAAEAPVDAPPALRGPAPSRRTKAPSQAQGELDSLMTGEGERPRGGGGNALGSVGGVGSVGTTSKGDGYGSGAGAAPRTATAPRPTAGDASRAAQAPAAAPVQATAPPPPPPAPVATKSRAKRSAELEADEGYVAAEPGKAQQSKDEKKAGGKNAETETLLQRADRLFADGRWAEAAAIYRELLRRDPRNEDAERWRRRLVAAENAEVEQRNANVAAKRAEQKRDSAESAAPARKQAAPKASKATSTESQ
ncbi:MAG TPA: zf-HC2 domain-containing protein [Polyangia bacterium]|jgi:hypothetical protein